MKKGGKKGYKVSYLLRVFSYCSKGLGSHIEPTYIATAPVAYMM
jgi:hypothetical protein